MENLSTEETLDLLIGSKVGHIAVIDGDIPYVSPLSYVVIDQELFFRTGFGRRVEAIRSNPRVCIEISRTTDDGGWECVIADGVAREVDDQPTREKVVSALLSKYEAEIGSPLSRGSRNPLPQPAIFVAVELSNISGRSSGSWFSIPMRPGRL